MKNKFWLAMMTVTLAVLCSAHAAAQDPIIHLATQKGKIFLPLALPDQEQPRLSCANLRVWFQRETNDGHLIGPVQYVTPEPTGPGTCFYSTALQLGYKYRTGLEWVGPNDYQVRFYDRAYAWTVINRLGVIYTTNFGQLTLHEYPN